MATRPALLRLSVLLLLLAVCGQSARAAAKVDAKSQAVLDTYGKFFSSTKGFSVKVNIDLQVEQQGKQQAQAFTQTYAAERPNKLAYTMEAPGGGSTLMSDGTEMSAYFKGFGKYATEEAPADWTAMFQNPIVLGSVSFGNAPAVIVSMLSEDPAAKLVEQVETMEYGGEAEIDGVKCHLLKATGGEIDWQIWIDAGKQPLVRQFIPDLSKAFAKMAKGQKGKSPLDGVKVTNTVSYKDWQIDPKFEADAFAFKVPEGAAKVGSFMEIITGRPKMDEPAPHVLLGQAAPAIELELLDGGKLDLSSYKDKGIVILDFWATWCGPCVKAMPVIEKVAAKYKDKGVSLFAVNLQEKPDEIKAFLDEAKLKLPVALDTDGATAAAYKADAIPQTVIIGKDGSVQVVHVGLSVNLEEQLNKELDALLAGKNLAEETLTAYKAKQDAKAKGEEKPEAKPKAAAEGESKKE